MRAAPLRACATLWREIPRALTPNALKLCTNAHIAVLLLIIQTTLKQLCEAVESQTCKERGTRGRAGCRQAGNQERTASQLKSN